MSDLVKINMRVRGDRLPAWCPACGMYSMDRDAKAMPIENDEAVGWVFRSVVGCKCGVVAELIALVSNPMVFAYELYAPKSLVPKLVARRLKGELGGAPLDWNFKTLLTRHHPFPKGVPGVKPLT